MKRSHLWQLIDRSLSSGIDWFVADARARGHSWRRIAAALTDATGLEVSYETVRAWYPDANGQAA